MYFLNSAEVPSAVVQEATPLVAVVVVPTVVKRDLSLFDFCGLGLIWWSRITGCVHVFMCVVVALMIGLQHNGSIHPSRLETPLTRSVGLWVNDASGVRMSPVQFTDPSVKLNSGCVAVGSWGATQDSYRVVPLILDFGKVDTRFLILAFYLLSAVFQIVGAFSEEAYYTPLFDGCNHISNFVEYSISASVLVLAISLQLGVTDVFTLVGVVSNTWSCMVFGLLAELWHQDSEYNDPALDSGASRSNIHYFGLKIPYYAVAHFAGWVSMAAALTAALSNLINYNTCINRGSDTFWIIGQVAAYFEIVLFSVFGLVQLVYLIAKPGRPNASASNYTHIIENRIWWSAVTEFMLIMLSLAAKVGLGIMVYTANLI
jgi:hypothetical protein